MSSPRHVIDDDDDDHGSLLRGNIHHAADDHHDDVDEHEHEVRSSLIQVQTLGPLSAARASQMAPIAICSQLEVDLQTGLTASQVQTRLSLFGPNRLPMDDVHAKSFLQVFKSEVREPMILLLFAVGILYFFLSEFLESLFVCIIICCVVLIEVYNEYKAKKAVALLSTSVPRFALVKRASKLQTIASHEVVLGDVLVLRPGQRVACDARVVRSDLVACEEAMLTGESVPMLKHVDMESASVVYAGTTVVGGSGLAVCVATGSHTRLGELGSKLKATKEKKTPLQLIMRRFAMWFLGFGISFCVLMFFLLHAITGISWNQSLLLAASLAFVTIPEELPLLIKAVMAVGAHTLSKTFKIIIKRVSAVEAIAACTVLVSDKTGTLTENKLAVKECFRWDASSTELKETTLQSEDSSALLLSWLMLTADPVQVWQSLLLSHSDATHVSSSKSLASLDPFDCAVMEAVPLLPNSSPRSSHEDGTTGRTFAPSALPSIVCNVPASIFVGGRVRGRILKPIHDEHSNSNSFSVVIKGSPEDILGLCRSVASGPILEKVGKLAHDGLRVLAYAQRPFQLSEAAASSLVSTESMAETLHVECAEGDFELLGIVAFDDPIREESSSAVKWLESSGVRVVIVSGDHPNTVAAVMHQIFPDASTVPDDSASYLSVVDCRLWRSEYAADSSESNFEDSSPQAETFEVFTRRRIWTCLQSSSRVAFARAEPEIKQRIVQALQHTGESVMAAGDGLNDALALKEANVGIAMGRNSADLAKDAAQVVLSDNNIASIVAAVQAGRRLYANLFKAVVFYLSCKIAIVFLFCLTVLSTVGPVFSAVQLIVMETFMDLGASLSFLFMPISDAFASSKPDVFPSLFALPTLGRILPLYASALAVPAAISFFVVDPRSLSSRQSCAFLAWMLSHVAVAYVIARMESKWTWSSFQFGTWDAVTVKGMQNFAIWAAAVVFALLALFGVPSLRELLGLETLMAGPVAGIMFVVLVATVSSSAGAYVLSCILAQRDALE
jgi:Ca2+-transporting ATPase